MNHGEAPPRTNNQTDIFMKVYLVYNGDGWLSTDSLSLVAVCTSKEKAEELLFDDLVNNYNVIQREDLEDEESDEDVVCLEDYINEYHATGQISANGWGYMLQIVDTDEIL